MQKVQDRILKHMTIQLASIGQGCKQNININKQVQYETNHQDYIHGNRIPYLFSKIIRPDAPLS